MDLFESAFDSNSTLRICLSNSPRARARAAPVPAESTQRRWCGSIGFASINNLDIFELVTHHSRVFLGCWNSSHTNSNHHERDAHL